MYRKKKVSGLSFVSDKSQMADDYWVDQSDQNVQAKWNKIKEISNNFQILTENKLKHLVRPVQLRQQFYNNRLADFSIRKRLEKAFMKIIEDGSEFSFAKQKAKTCGNNWPNVFELWNTLTKICCLWKSSVWSQKWCCKDEFTTNSQSYLWHKITSNWLEIDQAVIHRKHPKEKN